VQVLVIAAEVILTCAINVGERWATLLTFGPSAAPRRPGGPPRAVSLPGSLPGAAGKHQGCDGLSSADGVADCLQRRLKGHDDDTHVEVLLDLGVATGRAIGYNWLGDENVGVFVRLRRQGVIRAERTQFGARREGEAGLLPQFTQSGLRQVLALAGGPSRELERVGLEVVPVLADEHREIRRMHDSGDYNVAEIAALFSVSRPTVYRSLDRTAGLPPLPVGTRPVPDVTKYDQLLTRNLGQQ
jgi:Helix-turn-helix domain of resolvase